MNLRDFIKATIVDLVSSIEDAQNELNQYKAIINPLGTDSKIKLHEGNHPEELTHLEFEFAVEVQQKDEYGGGFSAQLAVLNLGGKGDRTESASNINKIRYFMPTRALAKILAFPGRFLSRR